MILYNKFQSQLQAWIPGHEFQWRVSSITHWKFGKLFRQSVSIKLPLMAKPDGLSGHQLTFPSSPLQGSPLLSPFLSKTPGPYTNASPCQEDTLTEMIR